MRSSYPSLIASAACALAFAVSAQATTQQDSSTAPSASSAPANNSGINSRDRSSSTIKPTDQPNDKTDIKLAAAVRRAIVKDKSLSMSAHNVKLVAINGAVTLRGPVKNADERAKVEADVKSVPGVSSVDNQLEAKNQ
jgi:hyperosmotically inducible protein